ncbi:hypothetical protein BCR43DRAFT_495244 [Syncephalastrum racemosum]|uniref:Uncharacterized protein n=1 Tax=Syncephalastrum racemosum TaxID=13706 RepID=A0A1X2H5I6_SYNRA|nr:hypothetical protein BCR43DRAFT_495244 [Syncephalastrum racemosum]
MPRQNAVAPIPIRTSPSTKAAVQLQHTLDRLQKQITKTRNELERTRRTRREHQIRAHAYAEDNEQCRVEIQQLMRALDSKQEILNAINRTSQEAEVRSRKLRIRAEITRKELDKARDQNKRALDMSQYYSIQDTLLEAEAQQPSRQLQYWRKELTKLIQAGLSLNGRSQAAVSECEAEVRRRRTERTCDTSAMHSLRDQLSANSRAFVDDILLHFGRIAHLIQTHLAHPNNPTTCIAECRQHVDDLAIAINVHMARQT